MTQTLAPNCSAIVCCYTDERWELLRGAIASLRAQDGPLLEILVVVDHNAELFARLSSEYDREAFPDVRVLENTGPRGLSGARNTGVAVAVGEVVAFLDDDAIVAANWSREILAPYADPSVLGVGGQVVARFAGGSRPRWFPPELDWIVGCTYEGHSTTEGPVRNVIGANMSFRRRVFEAVGGFHVDLGRTATLPLGCEETEFCIRARRQLGGVVWFTPAAVAYHYVPVSRTTLRYATARCFAEGRSKAAIGRLTGTDAALESELAYARRAIPLAFAHRGRALVGDRGAAARMSTILLCAGFVGSGYAKERAPRKRETTTGFEPVFVTQLDVEQLGDVSTGTASTGGRYGWLHALVRDGGVPVGVVDCALSPQGSVDAPTVVRAVEHVLPVRRDSARARRARSEWEPLVSVIIATRDRPEQLVRCLESIQAMRYEHIEIIVIDNGSATGAPRIVVESISASDPRVSYIYEPRLGLARAHNRGVQVARGEILAFTDDDVTVDPGWVDAIVNAFDADPTVGCVTGMIWPAELETASQWWTESFSRFGKGFASRTFDRYERRPADPLFPFAAGALGSGANMAFRSSALRLIRGFDPALGTGTKAKGGDDLAAFCDVILEGYALTYEPAALIHHTHRRDFDGLRRQARGYGVGLGSYLTRTVVRHPRHVKQIVSSAPRAVSHLLSSRSPKNAGLPADYPRSLRWIERAGVLAGPIAYARSRWHTRRDVWRFEPSSDTVVPMRPMAVGGE